MFRDAAAPGRRLGAALMLGAVLAGCAAPSVEPAPQAAAPQAAAAAVPPEAHAATPGAEALGIRVTALRLSAGGFMLDLRYRVVDAERAKPLLDRSVPAYLVDERTGAKLPVPTTPKLGRLRPTGRHAVHTDRDYGMLFGNPMGTLKPGARVTLVAGDVRLPHLIVQ